MSPLFVCSD